ncbi:hypothetical protein D3C80_2231680 [compost metagenome]
MVPGVTFKVVASSRKVGSRSPSFSTPLLISRANASAIDKYIGWLNSLSWGTHMNDHCPS